MELITRWNAKLSNGEICVEDAGKFQKGELSPWQKLKRYMETAGLHVVGLKLSVLNGEEKIAEYALPTGIFPHRKLAPIEPMSFDYTGCSVLEVNGKTPIREFVVIEARFAGFVTALYVDKADPTKVNLTVNAIPMQNISDPSGGM